MAFVVPSIVEVLMNKIVLSVSNHTNDWTAESTIISSNENLVIIGLLTRTVSVSITVKVLPLCQL